MAMIIILLVMALKVMLMKELLYSDLVTISRLFLNILDLTVIM